jgi:hypothetical protein
MDCLSIDNLELLLSLSFAHVAASLLVNKVVKKIKETIKCFINDILTVCLCAPVNNIHSVLSQFDADLIGRKGGCFRVSLYVEP